MPKKKKKPRKGRKQTSPKSGGGSGQQVRGFRPGTEPPHLQAQQARQELGPDAPWAQKQAVDLVAGRSPEEVEAMVTRWARVVLAVFVVLGLAGAFLYRWSIVAGIVVHVLAAAAVFLWYRLRSQQSQLAEMARTMGGKGGG